MRGVSEVFEMLLFAIAAMIHGTMLFCGKALLECANEMIEPGNKTVQATVDGKPVHSYVAEDRFER